MNASSPEALCIALAAASMCGPISSIRFMYSVVMFGSSWCIIASLAASAEIVSVGRCLIASHGCDLPRQHTFLRGLHTTERTFVRGLGEGRVEARVLPDF